MEDSLQNNPLGLPLPPAATSADVQVGSHEDGMQTRHPRAPIPNHRHDTSSGSSEVRQPSHRGARKRPRPVAQPGSDPPLPDAVAIDTFGDEQNEGFFSSNTIVSDLDPSASIVGTSSWSLSSKAAATARRRAAAQRHRSMASQVAGGYMSGLAYRYMQDADGSVVARALGRGGARVSHALGSGLSSLLSGQWRAKKADLQDTRQHAGRYFHREMQSLVLPRAAAGLADSSLLHMPLHFKRARSEAAAAAAEAQAAHSSAMVLVGGQQAEYIPAQRSAAAMDVVRSRRDEAFLPVDAAGATQGEEATRGCSTPEELLMKSTHGDSAGGSPSALGHLWRFSWESWGGWRGRRRRELRAYEDSAGDALVVGTARFVFTGICVLLDALRPGGDSPSAPAASRSSLQWLRALQERLLVPPGGGAAGAATTNSRAFLHALDVALDTGAVGGAVAARAAASLLDALQESHAKAPAALRKRMLGDAALILQCWMGRVASAFGVSVSAPATDESGVWQVVTSAAQAVSVAAAALASGTGDYTVQLHELLLCADASAAHDGNALGEHFDVVAWLEETHTLALASASKGLQGPQHAHTLFDCTVRVLQWTEERLRWQGRAGTAARMWLAWLDASLCAAVQPQSAASATKLLRAHLAAGLGFSLDECVSLAADGTVLLGGVLSAAAQQQLDASQDAAQGGGTHSRWDMSASQHVSAPTRPPLEVVEEVLSLQQRARAVLGEGGSVTLAALPATGGDSALAQALHAQAASSLDTSASASLRRSAAASAPSAAQPAAAGPSQSTKAYIRTWNRLQGIDSDSDSDEDADLERSSAALSAMESVSAKRARLQDWASLQQQFAVTCGTVESMVDDPAAPHNPALVVALCPPPCAGEELAQLLVQLLWRTWEPMAGVAGGRVRMLTPGQRLQGVCVHMILSSCSALSRSQSIAVLADVLPSTSDASAAFKQAAQESIAGTPALDQMRLWREYLKGMLKRSLRAASDIHQGSVRCDLRKWYSAARKVAASAASGTPGVPSEVCIHIVADAFVQFSMVGRTLKCRLDSKEYLDVHAACASLVALAGCSAQSLQTHWAAQARLWAQTSQSELHLLDLDRAQSANLAAAASVLAVRLPFHVAVPKLCAPLAADSAEQSWISTLRATQRLAQGPQQLFASLAGSCVLVTSILQSLSHPPTAGTLAEMLHSSYVSSDADSDTLYSFESCLFRDYAATFSGPVGQHSSEEALWRCLSQADPEPHRRVHDKRARLLLHLLHTMPHLSSMLSTEQPLHKLASLRQPLRRRLVWIAQASKMARSASSARSALVVSIISAPFDIFSWVLAPALAAASGNASAADAKAFQQQALAVGFPAALVDTEAAR